MKLIYLIVLIILLILALICIIQNGSNGSNGLKEPFSETLNQYLSPKKGGDRQLPAWYHNKFNYSYNEFSERNTDNLLLTFMCMKTKGIPKAQWNSDYDNILEQLHKHIPCYTGKQVYDLRTMASKMSSKKFSFLPQYPSNLDLIRKILEYDIQQMDKRYKKTNDQKQEFILAPVYAIIVQYPNKIYSYNGSEEVKYSTFDMDKDDLVPFQRKDISKMDTPHPKDNTGQIDTKILFVYPLYSKNPEEPYYPAELPEYKYKLPTGYQQFKLDKHELSIKGIVDMAKFFSGIRTFNSNIKLSPTKSQQCFIKCNNDNTFVCGCGTRINDSNDYKSYCTDTYEIDKDNFATLSNYLFTYRINEKYINLNAIQDISMDTETENRITVLINNNANNLPPNFSYQKDIPTAAEIQSRFDRI